MRLEINRAGNSLSSAFTTALTPGLESSFAILALLFIFSSGCAAEPRVDVLATARNQPEQPAAQPRPSDGCPRYILQAEKSWQLNSPNGQPFDASGLLLLAESELLTLNDRGASLHRVQFHENESPANLVPLTNLFTSAQLAPFAKQKVGRYDCEGIARDDEGRLYVCEEGNRWILRCDPKRQAVERLNIDWSPVRKYFHPADPNASFEGIAVGNGRLYVANERQTNRIIVVNLNTLAVVDDFVVRPGANPTGDFHYSDLCWFENALFVLLRDARCVLKVDPESHRVVAEYDFRAMENDPDMLYRFLFVFGTMEGLAVDRDFIWLVTDNNGVGRVRYPNDTRPTLFKCRRPDRK
jgi:hypothetical protein